MSNFKKIIAIVGLLSISGCVTTGNLNNGHYNDTQKVGMLIASGVPAGEAYQIVGNPYYQRPVAPRATFCQSYVMPGGLVNTSCH